jgi:ClpP class serine protease
MRAILFILKCIVGLFAAIGFLVVLAAAGLAILAYKSEPLQIARPEVPANAVLTLDLAPGVIELRPDNPLARASLRDAVALRDTVDALEAAGRDPRVKGLIARVGRGALTIAQAQELRDAIKRFRDRGKFAVAFAESFGEGGDGTRHYYLASAFDRIWLQPSGDLDLTGVLLESPFLRGALDKLGIEPQLGQREEFKGMMNMLTDTGLPEPQRRNLRRLAESWLGQIAAGVAEGRTIEVAAAKALIDGGPYDAEGALKAGLADRLGYRDQADEAALEQAGGEAAFFDLADYERAREVPEPDGPAVALIYGLGPVQLSESENDPAFGRVVMGADTVAKAISDALDDPEVEAMVPGRLLRSFRRDLAPDAAGPRPGHPGDRLDGRAGGFGRLFRRRAGAQDRGPARDGDRLDRRGRRQAGAERPVGQAGGQVGRRPGWGKCRHLEFEPALLGGRLGAPRPASRQHLRGLHRQGRRRPRPAPRGRAEGGQGPDLDRRGRGEERPGRRAGRARPGGGAGRRGRGRHARGGPAQALPRGTRSLRSLP